MLDKRNVKNSPKTTLIGGLIVLTSIVGFFAFKDVGMAEKIMGIAFGLGLMGVKDPRLEK